LASAAEHGKFGSVLFWIVCPAVTAMVVPMKAAPSSSAGTTASIASHGVAVAESIEYVLPLTSMTACPTLTSDSV